MNTKVFAVIVATLFVSAAAADDSCYANVVNTCTSTKVSVSNCTAKYGGINPLTASLQHLANRHLKKSFDFLLMSTYYSNYEKNRAGFEKLFRGLSDSTWDDAFDIIKYITKRGGEMSFINSGPKDRGKMEIYEFPSIAKAIDIEKELAMETYKIHAKASERTDDHDPGVAHYLEEKFIEGHAETIRKLSGYATDLEALLSEPDTSLSLYLFDEYLQKQ